ncbi:exodeoxyribonuclease VII small subunit [Candidatus Saccharibacteria bacterium]|nr:exodeoxyribonuclease VII small subunit [Candidatus Saccharibacteria bacterium]
MSNTKNLNQKIKKLDEKVEWFNSDEFELDKAVEEYKEALALAVEIEEDLKNLKNEVEVLEQDFSKDS